CLPQLQEFGLTEAPTSYGPDTVWSYEVGEKARLFDSHLTLDASVYYERWSDIQLQVPLSCGFFYTTNGERAGVYGAEAELQAKPVKELTVAAGVGYTHAKYAADSIQTGFREGDRIPNIPQYTANVSVTYEVPAFGAYDLVARLDDRLIGDFVDYTF